MNRDELTALFASLGADDPRRWADSQIDEGIPQLHRFVFLRQAWQAVVEPANPHWIASLKRSGGPTAAALDRLLASNSHEDIGMVVRDMQREVLFSLCQLLDDPGGIMPEVEGVSWGLFVTGGDGESVERLSMLHESVIETDPLSDQ